MSNFDFLKNIKEYALFAQAAIEAERVYESAPAMCAVGCRKALELAVKWVYSADKTMQMPYKDNLQSLIHEPSFRFAVDYNTWGKMPFIIKLGNLAVHTEKSVQKSDSRITLLYAFFRMHSQITKFNYKRHFAPCIVINGKTKTRLMYQRLQIVLIRHLHCLVGRIHPFNGKLKSLSAPYGTHGRSGLINTLCLYCRLSKQCIFFYIFQKVKV